MRHILTLLFLILALRSVAGPVTITTHVDKNGEPGVATTEFTTDGIVARVFITLTIVDHTQVKAASGCDLQVKMVTAEGEQYAYNQQTIVPAQNGSFWVSTTLREGNYVARYVDKDDAGTVFTEMRFVVKPKPMPDYRNNSTITFCTSVDDNWKAIGARTTWKTGECIHLYFQSTLLVDPLYHTWSIRRLSADGTEILVRDLNQGAGGQAFRKLATDDVCEFGEPGTYRVYLFGQDDLERNGDKAVYLSKGELTVQ
jgi:hypothetical protein